MTDSKQGEAVFEAPMMEETAAGTAAAGTLPAAAADSASAPGPGADVHAPNAIPLRWYVVQAHSGYEQRVAQSLRESIKMRGMEDSFGEVLVPKEKFKEIRDGRKRESERKFFPGYVLVQMRMSSEAWHLVKKTERVLGFIGGTVEKPLPITEEEAANILNRLRESEESPRPKTMFEVGEMVRAIDGAFKDFVGTVEKVDYEKNRLTVSIAIFGRATPVDLEFAQVEKDV